MRKALVISCCLIFHLRAFAQNIYFSSEFKSKGRDIYEISIEGKNLIKLTSTLGSSHYPHHINPKLSPDGSKLVFQSDPDGHDQYTLWIMDIDGSHLKRLSKKEGLYPCWSADGNRIYFSGRREGIWEILAIDISEGDEYIISHNKEMGIRPGWGAVLSCHPNGQFISFTYIREKKLYLLDLHNDTIIRQGVQSAYYLHPEYSKDGKWIAVNRKIGDSYDLVLVDFEGGSERILSTNVISYSAPAWNNSSIIFTGMIKGHHELFRYDLELENEKQISQLNTFTAMPTSR